MKDRNGCTQKYLYKLIKLHKSLTTKKLAQTFCLQGFNNQFIFIKLRNDFETQQQQQILLRQQQQPFIVLPQSQQQSILLLQQPQQPLLVLQQVQKQEKLQQPILILQQTQQNEKQLVLQKKPQQQKLMSQSSDRINNHIIDLDNQDPLGTSALILPAIKPEMKTRKPKLKAQIFKPKILKSIKTPKLLKMSKLKNLELQVKQESLKKDPSLGQSNIPKDESAASENVQALPSTSQELLTAFNSEEINENVKSSDAKDGESEEMKEIYTRIDYGGYQCNICQVTRLDRRSMLFHISGQHSHLRPFKCSSCDKTFKRKYSLKVHQLTHNLKNDVETYPCEKCNYRTPNKVSLRYHHYRVHTNEYRFTCEHCGRRFKVKRELSDHLVTHSGIQHMCDICGKLYRGEHLLRAHRRLHLDLYKFQCVICKKKLATQEGLTNHMKLHGRTYVCDECGMKFPSKYNLIKHRNVHTREQAFPCPECGKIFADQPTQKVHSLTHAGLKPYRCNVCGLGFTQRTPMMLHWKKKHPGETDPPPPVILKNILKSIEEQNGKKKK